MQLIAGRTGQEYNDRKNRKGAFWEDRYDATAIASDIHLVHCMTYIDLNMVRAAVVKHPQDWHTGGYYEIQNTSTRYNIINLNELKSILNLGSTEELKLQQNYWIDYYLNNGGMTYDKKWSQSIALGNQSFVDEIVRNLGKKARYREIVEKGDSFVLREPKSSYNTHFGPKKDHLRVKNTHFWNLNH
jgi:putative transposase